MKKYNNVFVLAVLFFLVGVNFASAMPAGDPKNEEQTVKDFFSSEEENSDIGVNHDNTEGKPLGFTDSESSGPQPLGNTIEIDAQGPYGTPSLPYYEGDTVNFTADINNGTENDYLFRWDVDNDGIWEKDFPGSIKGDPYYSHEFTDDHVGQAKVEAWDGVTMKTVSGKGNLWNEKYPGSWYMGSSYYGTVGMRFEISRDITLDDLGVCRNYYPYEYYNIRLWDASTSSLLRSVSNPYVPNGTWAWFSIAPITLPAGEYVLSVGIRGYYQYGDNNPGPSSDGIIDPINGVRSSNQYSYPNQDMGSTPIPFIDMNYSYSYQAPDSLEDTADVHVKNLAPFVDAGSDLTGITGEPVSFNGSFTDPGSDDTHIIHWDFDDGNTSTGDLTTTHTYALPGTYNVALKVSDDDGGIEIDKLTIIIGSNNTVENQIDILIESVKDLGLSFGLENSLLAKLNRALKSYENEHYKTAIKVLQAFINHVEALKGKKIPELEADALIDYTWKVIIMIRDEL